MPPNEYGLSALNVLRRNGITRILLLIILFTNLATAQKNGPPLSVCEMVKRPLDPDKVAKEVKKLLRGDDNCVLALIDSVFSNIITKKDKRFLITLDSIAIHSDGYVSDYLEEKGVNLFFRQLPLLAHYLTEKGGGNSQAVEKIIFESMSSYLSESKDPEKERKKISDFVEKEKAEKKIDEDEYIYVRSLMKRFNPKMFD